MSPAVDLGDLDRAVAQHLPGYLVTVSRRGRVRTSSVEPRVEDGQVVVDGAGPGLLSDLRAHRDVTFILPPAEPDGFTLLVDAVADRRRDLPPGQVRLTPSSVVLHRASNNAAAS
ncbi:hypothetical protein [Nocardioides sp. CFH 31398]|uniref:hypothetical protein n=1 Tax=Nocardioides sp. CFH 31398 TaxID=2919579 RepID=UPI001F05A039|nr:hypothetical protein [Nocardioides sp. CFH 31398]MCH1868175.1 hypothetical protein [Nocardioides sp. CFH 31398]